MTRLTEQEIEAIARRIAADLDRPAPGAVAEGSRPPDPASGSSPPWTRRWRRHGAPSRRSSPLPLKVRAGSSRESPDHAGEQRGARPRGARGDRPGEGRGQGRQEPSRHREDPRPRGAVPALRHRRPWPHARRAGAVRGDRRHHPVTNPTSTIICNAIGMLAAGNSVVFNVHPLAKRCSMQAVALLNKAITAAGGPPTW